MDKIKVSRLLFSAAYFILAAAITGLLVYFVILLVGNHITDDEKLVMSRTSVVVDEQGHEISKLYDENREPVTLRQIPKHVQNAFIVTEDSRFYKHSGIDLRGTMRAVVTNVLAGEKREGGSTITQQLARNAYLSTEKTWFRKMKEAAIAISLERKYSKKQILEMYLNQIYFGHGVYGVQMASKFFFNKDVSDLTVDEGALLAALPKGPNGYSPILHPKKALERRNLVLGLMQKNGDLSAEQSVRLKGKTLGLNVQKIKKHPEYDTYIDMVKEEAAERYHIGTDELMRGGYKIVVPISREAQKAAYRAFSDDAYFHGTNRKVSPEGAFVLMNKKGAVLAVQGGRNYVRGGFNHLTIRRQPGSAFKPLAVYGPALESGEYEPYSMLQDKEVTYKKYDNYAPKNYDGRYRGEMSMYDAVKVSENAPAVWLLNRIGVDTGKRYLSKMGMDLPDNGLAIALGGLREGVSPLQMASAYTAFSNEGKQSRHYFIQAIYNHSGKKIAEAKPASTKVFSPQTAWYMTRMLQSVVTGGTAQAGYSNTALAGKTGSTAFNKNGLRDAWFVGYSPNTVGAVWLGYDTTNRNQYLTAGANGDAVRLFKSVVNNVPGEAGLAFSRPKGVSDLDEPIQLAKVTNLQVKGTLGKFAMPALKLTWTPSSDKRIVYRIYAEADGKKELKGEVTGKNEYRINYVNPMARSSYYVIPYNPQTKREGGASRKVQVSWFSRL
ncbi:PBP1A family penicillin-binding protein [Sporolactobacillus sp. THM7-7]|nr:PBP1A family penicillin-binding protein [Sporolactobacillus sp. THM7-7]